MGLFTFTHQNHIPRYATFAITENGKAKAETYDGDKRTKVLLAFQQNGVSNTEEISRISGIKKGIVENLIPILIRGGYIRPVRDMDNDNFSK